MPKIFLISEKNQIIQPDWVQKVVVIVRDSGEDADDIGLYHLNIQYKPTMVGIDLHVRGS
jgi:hypothetical protein